MVSTKWRRTLCIVAALFTIVSVVGFATGQADKGAATGPVNAKGQQLSIAAIEFIQFQPYKVRVEAEKRAAADYGVKLTILQPPGVEGSSHAETILNALNQGFDALIIENDWPGSYEECFALAKKKGTILVDVHVPNENKAPYISQITIDNTGYGITAADKLGEATGGKANVLFLLNSPDIPNQARRDSRSSIARRRSGPTSRSSTPSSRRTTLSTRPRSLKHPSRRTPRSTPRSGSRRPRFPWGRPC
jgi:ABC-type sugar transport system substrate-binding protein